VVRGVDLEERCGQVVAVIGPNGSGKSSLLKAICGMLTRRGGSWSLNDRDISRLSPRKLANHGIRFVPQGKGVFPRMSVEDNLRVAGWSLGLDKATLRLTLEGLETSFPVLHAKRALQAGWLSGGEERQLEFARTAMGNPALVLLDEPSAGLSPKMALEMYSMIKSLRAPQRLILLVDQNVALALSIADVVYELRLGIVSKRFKPEAVEADAVVREWLK
jgi:branched-chain amino acid transport system ATP-binding protein